MTICGPRPGASRKLPHSMKRRCRNSACGFAKAGPTGYAQVYGKYNTTPYDKLVMDLMYIAHPSFSRGLSYHACNCENFVHEGQHGGCC